MNDLNFNEDQLKELEALEIRGGQDRNQVLPVQDGCINAIAGCGVGANQTNCINTAPGCGVITQGSFCQQVGKGCFGPNPYCPVVP